MGFSIVIEQRLRLRGLDAPELGTGQGKSPLPPLQKGVDAKRFVESRLKDCKFLIIKTHGSDKYDRYLVGGSRWVDTISEARSSPAH